MKEKLKSFSVLFFSALFLFNSCENFLDSKAVKEELDQEISYAKSPSFTIRVSPEKPEMGNVVTGNEKSVKVRDSFTVSFECSSEYIFEKWVVIDKDSGENASDYLDIENPSKQETKIKVLKMSNSLLVRPVCKSKIAVKSKTPTLAQNVVSRDSAIVVTFNTMIDKESFFFTNDELNKITGEGGESGGICKYSDSEGNCYAYKYDWDENGETVTYKNIKITSSNQNYLKYFGTVEVVDTILSLKTNPSVFIPIENTSVVLDVEISSDIKSVDGINIEASEKWQYKVDASTIAKCQVNMALDSNVTDDVILEGDGTYSVGDSFVIKAPIPANSNYEFSHWSYDDTKIVVANDENSSTRAIVIASSDSPIEIKAICKLKTKVNISLDSRVTDDAVLKGNGFYAVGENFDIEAQISAASNYEFSYWYYDESKVKIDDKNASSTKAVVMESSDTPVEIKAVCKLKTEYDHTNPVITSFKVEKHNYAGSGYSEINYKTQDEWENDSDAQQNFPEDKIVKITATASDEGGIKSFVLKEQQVTSRNGEIKLGREFVTTYSEDAITKTFAEDGTELFSVSTGDYLLQSEEGAVELSFYAVDNNDNQVQKNATVIKIDQWFNQENFIITNEPESWRQDEFYVDDHIREEGTQLKIDGIYYTVKRDNRTKPFDNDWFNEEIKTFRWAFRLYKDFNMNPAIMYSRIKTDYDDSEKSPEIVTEDCFGLKFGYKIDDSSLFEKGGTVYVKASSLAGDKQGNFKVYVPKPGKIKAVTANKSRPSYKGFFYDDTYNADFGYCNTKSFMTDTLPEERNDNEYLYPNMRRPFKYSGIENGMMSYFVAAEGYENQFTIEEDAFKSKKANFLSFNYYGEKYRSYCSEYYAEIFYNGGSSIKEYDGKFFGPTHRILGKTGDIYSYDDSNVEEPSASNNDESLTITKWTYKAASDSSSLSTVTFELSDSHIKQADEEVIDFVVISSGYKTDYYFTLYGIATLDEKTNEYTAVINDTVMMRTWYNTGFTPYRLIVKNGKTSEFQGTFKVQSDLSSSNGKDEYGKNKLFARSSLSYGHNICNDSEESFFGLNAYAEYAMSINNHGKEIYTVATIGQEKPIGDSSNVVDYFEPVEYKNAKFYLRGYDYHDKFDTSILETKYKTGEYKTAILDTRGPVIPKDFKPIKFNTNSVTDDSGSKCTFIGIPLEDIVDGDYCYHIAIEDEYGNFSYNAPLDRLKDYGRMYLYTIDDSPVYDFSSKDKLNRTLGGNRPNSPSDFYSVFYKMAEDGWEYVWTQTLTTTASTNADLLFNTVKPKLENAGWVKYHTGKKGASSVDDRMKPSPAAWTYDYFGEATAATPMIMEQPEGFLISGKTPVLCYVVASSRNRDATGEDWELRPRYINPRSVNLSSIQTLNIYTYDKSEIPDGWYYKVFIRYAVKNNETGKTELKLWQSDLRQK